MCAWLPTRRENGEGGAVLQTISMPLLTTDVGLQQTLTANTLLNKVCTKPRCCTEDFVCYICSMKTWSFPYFLWNKLKTFFLWYVWSEGKYWFLLSALCKREFILHALNSVKFSVNCPTRLVWDRYAWLTGWEWESYLSVLEAGLRSDQTIYYYFQRRGRLNTYLRLLIVHLPTFLLIWQASGVLSSMTDKHENNNEMPPKYLVFC